MNGYYHSKETFGTVDGPGIRYVLFLSGCTLGCAFCHNPDTWERSEQTITPQEVVEEVEEYRSFYDASGGGITISGGEPLLQPDFVAEVFQLCHEAGISTVLDTAGYCSAEALLKVLPYTDQVLFSLKAASVNLHKELTAADTNETLLRNLRYISSRRPVTLRYVVIPGISDSDTEIAGLISLVSSLAGIDLQVDLLAYHLMGAYKWKELGLSYKLEGILPAKPSDVDRVKDKLRKAGIKLAFEK